MPRRRHRPYPTELIAAAEATMLLGVHLPALRRWDGSGEFPTRCHPINAYGMCLRLDGMELRKKILNGRRVA